MSAFAATVAVKLGSFEVAVLLTAEAVAAFPPIFNEAAVPVMPVPAPENDPPDTVPLAFTVLAAIVGALNVPDTERLLVTIPFTARFVTDTLLAVRPFVTDTALAAAVPPIVRSFVADTELAATVPPAVNPLVTDTELAAKDVNDPVLPLIGLFVIGTLATEPPVMHGAAIAAVTADA